MASRNIAHVAGYQDGRFAAISPYWLKIITRVGDLRVYLAIAMHANGDTASCFPGRATLVELTGMPPSAVSRSIGNLEKIGALDVVRTIGRGSRYEVVSPAIAILRNARRVGMTIRAADDSYRLVNCPDELLEDVRHAWSALDEESAINVFRNGF